MADEKHVEHTSDAQKLIVNGASIVGAAAGGAVGFFLTGPVGAAAASGVGALIGGLLQTAGEICHRQLSRREEVRIGAAFTYASLEIQERLSRGEQPRTDGFFTRDQTNRSQAEELFEGVLMKCKNEHEERKTRFVANIFSNAAFMTVSAANANAVVLLADRLSYRQLCMLAAVGRLTTFPDAEKLELTRMEHCLMNGRGDVVLAGEAEQLQSMYSLLVTPTAMSGVYRLTDFGKCCFDLMGLQHVPAGDIETVVKQASDAEGDLFSRRAGKH